MGVRISAQLLLFFQSVLLGLGAGAVYGVLRPFRRFFRSRLAPALDLLYGLGAAAAASAFLLRPADGVLRGFTLLGAAGGMVLWFCGFDAALRPLWDFWAGAAALAVRTALLPLRLTVRLLGNLLKRGKWHFSFAEKRSTIGPAGLRRAHGKPGKRQNRKRQTGTDRNRQNKNRQSGTRRDGNRPNSGHPNRRNTPKRPDFQVRGTGNRRGSNRGKAGKGGGGHGKAEKKGKTAFAAG